jgi:hypothetical protein
LQSAYEQGFAQEYDHDSFALLDRIEGAIDGIGDDLTRWQHREAWLRGAADALIVLANAQASSGRAARKAER